MEEHEEEDNEQEQHKTTIIGTRKRRRTQYGNTGYVHYSSLLSLCGHHHAVGRDPIKTASTT